LIWENILGNLTPVQHDKCLKYSINLGTRRTYVNRFNSHYFVQLPRAVCHSRVLMMTHVTEIDLIQTIMIVIVRETGQERIVLVKTLT